MADPVSRLKSVYLIHGSEDLLLEAALARLKGMVSAGVDLDFDMASFDGDSANAHDVVASCNTLPFLSERRLVIVRHVDRMPKDGLDTLAAYCADPSPTTILVLVAEKFAKNLKLYKAVDKLGGVAEYKPPRKAEYPAEVVKLVEERGRTMPLAAAELLVDAVGYDLRRISVEIDKLVSFAGARTALTRVDVEEVVSDTAETSVFEFTDALANRDCAGALRLLADLLGQGESIHGIHALSLRTLRDLIATRALLDRGQGSAAEVSRVLGRPDWQVKRLPGQARAFSAGELVELLRAAAKGEAEMKTSREPRLVFERWVVKFCGAG